MEKYLPKLKDNSLKSLWVMIRSKWESSKQIKSSSLDLGYLWLRMEEFRAYTPNSLIGFLTLTLKKFLLQMIFFAALATLEV